VKYRFIDTNRHSYPVKSMCQALKVSTSGYYAARSRPPSARSERQTLLTSQSGQFMLQATHMVRRASMLSFPHKVLRAAETPLPS
jgi:hypothetical protein